ncbi:hypothetical protein KUV50_13550 [Membranicola marinus]|uniref:Tat pathway signal protein n=1 Tax=Membranihabitans marinus TaxID=1227546 RepID=A0A953L7X3_9BACT|nr:hypothetical protein [Membranihabitans marinus]MBY5959172.1 hypothetical protein [Membranihabitans marinus]
MEKEMIPEIIAPKDKKIWACFMHLSFNFAGGIRNWGGLRTEFEPDISTWDAAIDELANQGINMVLMNLDDSVLWDSHPEIALKNAWTPERLRIELDKIRKKGIEPIPVLNFAATHDAWLGEYSMMVSTPKYYEVCSNLISEAIDIFDGPRFIHFGMDEEDIGYQKHFDYIVIRREERWWADLYFYIGEAFKKSVRPWVWSDYMWHYPDEFFKMMPKSVVQSNWYYGEAFEKDNTRVKAYLELEREGYDQIPTGSFHARPADDFKATNETNIGKTVQFCSEHISDDRLMGFMQTFWMPTTKKFEPIILKAIDLMGAAKNRFYNK